MIAAQQRNDNNLNFASKLKYIQKRLSIKWSDVVFSESTPNQISNSEFDMKQDFDPEYLNSDFTESYSSSSLNNVDIVLNSHLPDRLVQGMAKLQMDLCEQSNTLKSKVKCQIENWDNILQSLIGLSLSNSIMLLELNMKSCEALQMELFDLQINKETMDLSVPGCKNKEIKDLEILKNDLEIVLNHCNDIQSRQIELESVQNHIFIKFKDQSLQRKLSKIKETFTISIKYENIFRLKHEHLLISNDYVDKLLKFTSNCYYVYKTENYWDELMLDLKLTDIPINTISMNEMYSMLLSKDNKIEQTISNLTDLIHAEKCISDQISQIENKWQGKEFKLLKIKPDNLIVISNYDDIFTDCLETTNVLSAIRLSPHVKKYLQKVIKMEELSQSIYSSVSDLKQLQFLVVQYKGMLTYDNKDTHCNLRQESIQFDKIFYTLNKIMEKIQANPSVSQFNQMITIHKSVQALLKQFISLQSSINKHLEEQRMKFGRFYFIGDNDLIELMGCVPKRIQQHVNKVFSSIKSINFLEDCDLPSIVSIETLGNETLHFPVPIKIPKSSNVSDVFKTIEKQLQYSFSSELQRNINYFMDHGLEMFLHLSESTLIWIENTFSQCVLLLSQILWTRVVEISIANQELAVILDTYSRILLSLSNKCFCYLGKEIVKSKITMLLFEIFQQRSVLIELLENNVTSTSDPSWRECLKFYSKDNGVVIRVGFLEVQYRYEIYVSSDFTGIIRTPLIDRCFLSITDSARVHIGSLLFGPAGTGKTESAKQLARYLGRFILIYNCGESFSEESLERILRGASRVGAWICFDEFNRLSPKKMNMALDFVEKIENKLQMTTNNTAVTYVETLFDDDMHVHEDTFILLTMNKEYRGRYQLPIQINNLFRSFAMTEPDTEQITRVLLNLQGFQHSDNICAKILCFFKYCSAHLIMNTRYDFGIRTLKVVLLSAGRILKECYSVDDTVTAEVEESCIVKSIEVNIKPRLSMRDVSMMDQFIDEIFLTNSNTRIDLKKIHFLQILNDLCGYFSPYYVTKMVQLSTLLKNYKCVIIHGVVGSGKTLMWKSLKNVFNKCDPIHNIVHFTINPNTTDQYTLYGQFDQSSGEWTDGLLPKIFRNFQTQLDIGDCKDNVKKSSLWIIFDGSVSQSWIENLNSLFDDNETLTLSNGEHLKLPTDMRIIVETDSLTNATPSTISRCGILHLDGPEEDDDTLLMHLQSEIKCLLRGNLTNNPHNLDKLDDVIIKMIYTTFVDDDIIKNILRLSSKFKSHIMNYQESRSAKIIVKYLKHKIPEIILNCQQKQKDMKTVTERYLIQCLMIAAGSDLDHTDCGHLSRKLIEILPDAVPKRNDSINLNEFWLDTDAEWKTFQEISLETTKEECSLLSQSNCSKIIIKTKDTVRVDKYLQCACDMKIPTIFCGPPGSGKSMTIIRYFSKIPSKLIVTYNFNCDTTPNHILTLFDQHCRFVLYPTSSSSFGIVSLKMIPKDVRIKKLVFFFDEINLQQLDHEQIQYTSLFLRQIFDKRRFFHNSLHNEIVISDNIIFVAACNPANSGKRISLSNRMLHHTLIVFVDHPSDESLYQIYGIILERGITNAGLFSVIPYEKLTEDSVRVFTKIFKYLLNGEYKHYLCTLRDFSRWIFTFLSSIKLKNSNLFKILRIWAVIGLHVFGDRLVDEKDRLFVQMVYVDVLNKWNISLTEFIDSSMYCLRLDENLEGIEYCDIFSLENVKSKVEMLCSSTTIVTDQMMDQLLRLLTCIKNKCGGNNAIVIGNEGSGREYFVDILSVVSNTHMIKIQTNHRYQISDFENDLRTSVRLAVFENKTVIILIKYNSFVSSDIIERASPLLAHGNVDNLFDDEEYEALVDKVREINTFKSIKDSDRLSTIIQEKLKFIIIISSSICNKNDQIINSQAIFNRCHITWFGGWNNHSFNETASKCLLKLIEYLNGMEPRQSSTMLNTLSLLKESIETILINCHIFCHMKLSKTSYYNMPMNIQIPFTDSHFIKFLRIFHTVFLYTFNRRMNRYLRQKDGTEIIQETMKEIKKLEQSFEEKQKKIEQLENNSLTKLQLLNDRRSSAETTEKQFQLSQEQLQNQEILLFKKRKELNEKIKKQEQELSEAESYFRNLQRKQIFEIKTMKHPPQAVKIACEAVCDLLNETVNNWNDVLGVILKDNFVSKIFNFNWKNVSPSKKQEIFRKYLSNSEFTVKNVSKASYTMGVIVKWTIAQLNYVQTLDKIIPLKLDSETLDKENDIKRLMMSKCQDNLRQIRKAIDNDEKENTTLRKKIDTFQNEIMTINIKLSTARQLTHILDEQNVAWIETINCLTQQDELTIVNSILASIVICYAGHLSMTQKDELIKEIYCKYLSTLSKFTQPKSSVQLFKELDLNDLFPIQKQLEHLRAIISTCNMVESCPLIIDASGKAAEHLISKSTNQDQIIDSSFCDTNFYTILKTAVRLDSTLLIRNAELFDPIVTQLIRQLTKDENFIHIKGERIKVSTKFRIILFSEIEKWQIPVEISTNVTVISFNDNVDELKQFLVDILLEKKYPVETIQLKAVMYDDSLESSVMKKENQLIEFLVIEKNKLLNSPDTIQRIQVLKEALATAVEKKKEQLHIFEATVEIIEKYWFVFKVLEQLIILLLNMEKWCTAYKFPISGTKKFLIKFIDKYGTKLSSSVKTCTTVLLEEAFQHFLLYLRHADYIPFAVNLCYISRSVSQNSSTVREQELWHALKHCLANDNEKKLNTESKITALAQYLVKVTIDTSLFEKEIFKKWIASIDILTDFHLISDHLPQLDEYEQSIFICIIYYIFQPNHFDKGVKYLVQSVLNLNIDTVLKRSSLEHLKKTLWKKTAFFKPILILSSEQTNPITILKSLKPPNCTIRRLSSLSLKKVTNYHDIFGMYNRGFFWFIVTSSDSITDYKFFDKNDSKTSENRNMSTEEILSLFRSVHTKNRNCKFIFISNINNKVSDILVQSSSTVIIELDSSEKSCIERNLILFPISDDVQRGLQDRLYLLLILFHSFVQIKSEETGQVFHSNCKFNDFDFLYAANIVKLSFELESQESAAFSRYDISSDFTNVSQESMSQSSFSQGRLISGDDLNTHSIKVNNKRIRKQLKSIIIKCIYGARVDSAVDLGLFDSIFDDIFGVSNSKIPSKLMIGTTLVNIPKSFKNNALKEWIKELPQSLNIGIRKISAIKSGTLTENKVKFMRDKFQRSLLSFNERLSDSTETISQSCDQTFDLIDRQQKYFAHKFKYMSAEVSESETERFFLREIVFGCQLFEEILKYKSVNFEEMHPDAKVTKASMTLNVVPNNFKLLFTNGSSNFDIYIQDIILRMRYFSKNLENNMFNVIKMSYLFHPEMFLQFTKLVTSRRMKIPIDKLNLYLTFPNQMELSLYWSCSFYQMNLKSVNLSSMVDEVKLQLFWRDKRPDETLKNIQTIKIYQYPDEQDLIAVGTLILNDVKTSESVQFGDNVYFLSNIIS